MANWPTYQASQNVPGMLTPGNIDIQRRFGAPGDPITHNPNGSTSTVYSGSIEDKFGRQILVPFVIPDGAGSYKIGTPDEARKRYEQSGEHLGIFDHYANADQYATYLHRLLASGMGLSGNPGLAPMVPQDMNARMSDVSPAMPQAGTTRAGEAMQAIAKALRGSK